MSINIEELKKENKELSNLFGQVDKTSYAYRNRRFVDDINDQVARNHLLIKLQEKWDEEVNKDKCIYINKYMIATLDERGVLFGLNDDIEGLFYTYVCDSHSDNFAFFNSLSLKLLEILDTDINYFNDKLSRLSTLTSWDLLSNKVEALVSTLANIIHTLQSDLVQKMMASMETYIEVLIETGKNN